MTPTNKQNLVLGIVAVALLAAIAWISIRQTDRTDEGSTQISQTLSPTLFEGKTREAYQVAADLPDVLKELPCFCGCMENNGHENNLFCFRDSHGST